MAELVRVSHNPSARVTGTVRYRIGNTTTATSSIELTSAYRITPTITANPGWTRQDVDLPYGSFVNNLVPIKATYSFTTLANVSALLQYNGQTGQFSSNIRLALLNRSGTGLFVVYNDRRGYIQLDRTRNTRPIVRGQSTRACRSLIPPARQSAQRSLTVCAFGGPRCLYPAESPMYKSALAAVLVRFARSSFAKRSTFILAIVVATGAVGLAQGSVEKMLLDLEAQWEKAAEASDGKALDPLLAPSFVFYAPDGTMQTKAEFVADATGSKWQDTTGTEMKVTVTGDPRSSPVSGLGREPIRRGNRLRESSASWIPG